MSDKTYSARKMLYLFGLFFIVLISLTFADNLFSENYKKLIRPETYKKLIISFQEAPPSGDSGGSSSTSTSTDTSTDSSSGGSTSGTYTDPATGSTTGTGYTSTDQTTTTDSNGVQTTTYSWTGGSSTSTYDPATGTSTYTSTSTDMNGQTYTSTSTSRSYTDASGATVYESTSSYTDPATGQVRSSSSTSSSTSYTDPTTGQTVYESKSSYTDPTTGEVRSYDSKSTSYTDPNTGAMVSSTSSSSYDPISGQQVSYTSTSTSSSYTDPVTGATVNEYKSESTDSRTGQTYGSSGVSTSYTDPVTGATGYKYENTNSYPDWRTGELVTSTSSSTSSSYNDPVTGATVNEYKSDSTYRDYNTGKDVTTTSSSSSSYGTNDDGTTWSKSDSTWTDPMTGQPSTSTYTSNYDSNTGTSTSTNSYVDPRDGKTYTSLSESTYDSVTGESKYTYKYTDPRTGQELLSYSENTREANDDGTYAYTNTYTLTDSVTGEKVETPYYGVYGGCTGGCATYYYLDSGSGVTYPYQSSEAPDADVHSYMTADGSTYVYTDTQKERERLADTVDESFAIAVDADIPIGETENAVLKEEGFLETVKAGEAVTTEIVGEPITSHTDFLAQVEERNGEKLTEEQAQIVTAEYESFEERVKYLGETHIDPTPETYAGYVEMYNSLDVPDEERPIKSSEDFQKDSDFRTGYYTKRDEIYSRSDLSSEQKASEQVKLEESISNQYHEQFGDIKTVAALPEAGVIPTDEKSLESALSTLRPEAMTAIVSDEFKDDFARLEKLGIPTNNPAWKNYEAQIEAKTEDLLEKQEQGLVNDVISGCQGSVGGASDSCGQKAVYVQEILDSCKGSGESCREVAQIMATQYMPENFVDKKDALEQGKEIVNDAELFSNDAEMLSNDPTKGEAWVYSVDIIPEKLLASDIYKEYKSCTGADCGVRAEERFRTSTADLEEKWTAQHDSLTSEQYQMVQDKNDLRREEYIKTISPELDKTRDEIPDSQKPLFDNANEQFVRIDSERIQTMQEFRDKAAEKGHDVAQLDFYIEQSKQHVDGARDGAVHKDFDAVIGSIRNSNEYANLYLEVAGDIAKADASGIKYKTK
ncbi:MAG: hypothetical protein Q7S22_01330 [Candidatus Micrarchaeota archaeon]|nr:hypothetical protein [Candidatus Micrarchaeota archaeon]